LEAVDDWDIPTLLTKEPAPLSSWLVNSFKRLVGAVNPEPSPPHPNIECLAPEPWRVTFVKNCQNNILKLENEAALAFLNKKGYEILKDVTVEIDDFTEHFQATQVYLPLFVCTYTFEEEYFGFIVNGKNGKTVGQRPYGMMGKLWQAGTSGIQMLDSLFWGKK